MERDPGDFEQTREDGMRSSDEDARLDAYIESLPPCPGLPSTDEEIAAADAEAEADIAAGRVIPHEKVAEWLKTIGTPDFRPMPREWLE